MSCPPFHRDPSLLYMRGLRWTLAHVRRKFSEEFKQEAVRHATLRGVSMAQASRGLSIYANRLRTWTRMATPDAAAVASGWHSAKVY